MGKGAASKYREGDQASARGENESLGHGIMSFFKKRDRVMGKVVKIF